MDKKVLHFIVGATIAIGLLLWGLMLMNRLSMKDDWKSMVVIAIFGFLILAAKEFGGAWIKRLRELL